MRSILAKGLTASCLFVAACGQERAPAAEPPPAIDGGTTVAENPPSEAEEAEADRRAAAANRQRSEEAARDRAGGQAGLRSLVVSRLVPQYVEECNKRFGPTISGDRCREVEVECAYARTISRADRMNGIEQRVVFGITSLEAGMDRSWYDRRVMFEGIRYGNGSWQIEDVSPDWTCEAFAAVRGG